MKPTLTEFLQHSGRILPELEQGQVVLRRRQGDDIVVLSRAHWDALSASVLALAGSCDWTEEPTAGGRPAASAPPWMALLRQEDREACLRELAVAAIATWESGQFRRLADLIAQWRATALATWDEEAQVQPEYREDRPLPLARP